MRVLAVDQRVFPVRGFAGLKQQRIARFAHQRIERERAVQGHRIVADPVLPALLQAARMTLETIPAPKQKESL